MTNWCNSDAEILTAAGRICYCPQPGGQIAPGREGPIFRSETGPRVKKAG